MNYIYNLSGKFTADNYAPYDAKWTVIFRNLNMDSAAAQYIRVRQTCNMIPRRAGVYSVKQDDFVQNNVVVTPDNDVVDNTHSATFVVEYADNPNPAVRPNKMSITISGFDWTAEAIEAAFNEQALLLDSLKLVSFTTVNVISATLIY